MIKYEFTEFIVIQQRAEFMGKGEILIGCIIDSGELRSTEGREPSTARWRRNPHTLEGRVAWKGDIDGTGV